jgi:FMN phosphatase YigB (HAD superfamily)
MTAPRVVLFTLEGLIAAPGDAPVARPGAAVVLGAVRAAGARIGVVATAWRPWAEALRAAPPFADAVDAWQACGPDAVAPAVGLYTLALADLGGTPAQALLVGTDPMRDVAPALALGMSAVWLREEAGAPSGPVPIDPHGALPVPAAIVPEPAQVATSLADVRRMALTWLWAGRGGRSRLTRPLPG